MSKYAVKVTFWVDVDAMDQWEARQKVVTMIEERAAEYAMHEEYEIEEVQRADT